LTAVTRIGTRSSRKPVAYLAVDLTGFGCDLANLKHALRKPGPPSFSATGETLAPPSALIEKHQTPKTRQEALHDMRVPTAPCRDNSSLINPMRGYRPKVTVSRSLTSSFLRF